MQQGSTAAPLPDRQMLRQEVAQRCPDVPPQVLDEVFAQLDDDYFRVFTAAEIATHVLLLAAVDEQHPVQLRVVSRPAQQGGDPGGSLRSLWRIFHYHGLNDGLWPQYS